MSSNGQFVALPADTLVDLFAATTFTAPKQLAVHNKSGHDILVGDPATPPANTNAFVFVKSGEDSQTGATAAEFWAYSPGSAGGCVVYDPAA